MSDSDQVQRVVDLVRHITSICKDDQVRVRIAAGAFELALGEVQGLVPAALAFEDRIMKGESKLF